MSLIRHPKSKLQKDLSWGIGLGLALATILGSYSAQAQDGIPVQAKEGASEIAPAAPDSLPASLEESYQDAFGKELIQKQKFISARMAENQARIQEVRLLLSTYVGGLTQSGRNHNRIECEAAGQDPSAPTRARLCRLLVAEISHIESQNTALLHQSKLLDHKDHLVRYLILQAREDQSAQLAIARSMANQACMESFQSVAAKNSEKSTPIATGAASVATEPK